MPTPGVYYRIIAKHSGKALDVRGGTSAVDNGIAIQQYDPIGGDNQAFRFERQPNGLYMIIAKHSGKALDITSASMQNGTPVIQYAIHGGDNQLFRIVNQGNGYFRIINKRSNKGLDISGGSEAKNNGIPLIQWDATGGDNQLFTFTEYSSITQPTTNISRNLMSFEYYQFVALKSDINKYACMCNSCQKTVTPVEYSAFLHCDTRSDITNLRAVKLPNGNFAFMASNNKFLAVCNGCVSNGTVPNFLMFHETSPNQPWAQFEVKELQNGKYSIYSIHSKLFVARCNGCSPTATYPNQVTAHANNANEDWAQWTIEGFQK